MKKISIILTTLLLALVLVSCTNKTTCTNANGNTTTKSGSGETSLMIHYKRTAGDYSSWALWMWKKDADGKKVSFNGNDDFGTYALYTIAELGIGEEDLLGFIVAKNPGSTWDAKDVDADRFIDLSLYEKDSNNVYHIYLFQGDKNIYSNKDKLKVDNIESAAFSNANTINVVASNPVSSYELYENGTKIKNGNVLNLTEFNIGLESDADVSKIYTVKVTFEASKATLESSVQIVKLFNEAFDEQYYYDGELGAIYTNSSTEFKVWSPVSQKIVLKVYTSGTPTSLDSTKGNDTVENTVEMTLGEKGVWSAIVEGDLEGKYYTYTVFNASNPNGTEIVDPYAKSTGVNGLRGMIVDFSKTNPEGWDSMSKIDVNRLALTVYETHVADVTSSATWGGSTENAKKFMGLIEKGTTYTNSTGEMTVSTGFDHIRELGVNAVQLLPIFDQANDETNPEFNWGYNPLNYNTLEGVYSSNPYDGYQRIIEFKKVVKAFNEEGIIIIMDVVYNHVNGAIGSNFDVLMPGYYFRYNKDGSLSNGSGCGNETASEKLMFRKFMIDSTSFWLDEYKLGGFRFDLMGLHDLTTMDAIATKCKTINSDVVIYGEPWTGGSTPLSSREQASQANGQQYTSYGAFNDKYRDELVKGGLNSARSLSWISDTSYNRTNMDILTAGIRGIARVNTTNQIKPENSVTYVTCHDNYTLYDRFKASGMTYEPYLKQMSMLANAMVLTSQGTSFILAGEEFLRTKGGNSNSYNASYKVNELDYSLKIKNYDMFLNYCQLIQLKQAFDGLHLDSSNNDFEIELLHDNNTVKYVLSDSTVEYVFIHHNGHKTSDSDTIDLTGYTIYLDTLGLLKDTDVLGETKINPFQTIIAVKAK